MNSNIVHSLARAEFGDRTREVVLEREWLVTNGLGGYASGTVSGSCSRRYHGLLIAALPAPLGRYVMFNHLTEEIKLDDRRPIRLDDEEINDTNSSQAATPF